MNNTIGLGALKIACIQTLPGYEFSVRDELGQACIDSPDIIDYAFFKSFGSFDIVLVYLTEEFGAHLRKSGTIKGILKSTILHCYPYIGINASDILNSVKEKTFVSFSLLKISPGLKNLYPQIDAELRDFFCDDDGIDDKLISTYLLGSLGWNELTVLTVGDDLETVIKETFEYGGINLDDQISVVQKTLSFICINYEFLPSKEAISNGIEYTRKFFDDNLNIKGCVLNSKSCNLYSSITTTLKSSHIVKSKKYFKKFDFEYIDIAGRKDVTFYPKGELTLAEFMAILFDFRFNFKDGLIETNSVIGLISAKVDGLVDDLEEIPSEIKPVDVDYDKLENIFDSELASSFSNIFYNLNSFFQSPLYGSIFRDMRKYPDYIIGAGEVLKETNSHLQFAQGSREVTKLGAELRTYGTFDTLEDVAGKFTELRGGAQLSINAIQFFPQYVLDRLKIEWMGFVVTSDPKFFHINEVINVPSEALWKPDQWWALFHEIAHIIIDNDPEILSYDVPEVKQYFSNKNFYDNQMSTLTEFTAEIIGFELFFFGDFDKYLKILWRHLVNIDRYQEHHLSLEGYALRTFFVQMFIGHFRKSEYVNFVSKKQFSSDLDYIYVEIINHMDYIEKITERNLFNIKEFTASLNAKMIMELYPYAVHLNRMINKYKIRQNKKSLDSVNTKTIVDYLKNGKLWTKRIVCPEAVLYKLICMDHINFSTRIATILTFWNQQMIRINEGDIDG